MLNLGSKGLDEVQIMSSEGEMSLFSRMPDRTALPILPVVPVRASIFVYLGRNEIREDGNPFGGND